MIAQTITFYPSTRRQVGGTVYSDWFNAEALKEILAVLEVTAQGAYTDETLDVTIQGKCPSGSGNPVNLAQFTQVGNVVASVPYSEPLKLSNFSKELRVKIVTAGTAVDYTFSVTANGR